MRKTYWSFQTTSGYGVSTHHDGLPYIAYTFSSNGKKLWNKLIRELEAAGYTVERQ